nr:shikimate dehydrogenase [Arcanobacterium phocae]
MSVDIKLGLIGDPISHSLSPAIHSRSLLALGIHASYQLLPVGRSELATTLNRLADDGYTGINVTMPYKRDVIEYLDAVTPSAALAQSVNTILFDQDKKIGYSTDGMGMLYPLIKAGYDLSRASVAVIGSGGAGKAVVLAAAEYGAGAITLLNREGAGLRRARELADRIASQQPQLATPRIDVCSMVSPAAQDVISRSDIVLNCTSVGMAPAHTGFSPIPHDWIRSNHVVADAVYFPRRTQLVQDALTAQATVFDGVHMLVAQALLAEEFWLGRELSATHFSRIMDESEHFSH